MSLLDYIRGNRKGKKAHKLEKEAMRDPFLAEALEGFDLVDDDHMARMNIIQAKIGSKVKREEDKKYRSMWTSVAAVAAAVVVIVVVSHFGINVGDNGLHAQNSPIMPIDIYIPEAVYTENIAMIATKNTELTRGVSIQVSSYKAEFEVEVEYEELDAEFLNTNTEHSLDDLLSPSALKAEIEAIQVYMPTGIDASQKRINRVPEPLIGMEQYRKYLAKEIKRPMVWPCENKKGKVLLEFSVDELGKPYDIVVEYGFCGASDDEAVRLLKDGPRWTPSNMRGQLRVEF